MSESQFEMITTITGGNSFVLQDFVRQQVSNFVTKHGELAVERIDGEESDVARIVDALQSMPFLADRKLIIITGTSNNKENAEKLTEYLDTVSDTVDVLLVEQKLDKRSVFYKALKTRTIYREFNELDAPALGRWLSEAAQSSGGSLALSDAQYLIGRIGTDQLRLSNELQKLIQYDPRVTKTTIDLLTEKSPQSTIFELLEAVLSDDVDNAFRLYEEQRKQRVEPQQIIAMLTWQLHVMALVKTAGDRSSQQIASEAKLNPFVVTKSQKLARFMTYKDIKRAVGDLLKLDQNIKQSRVDADEGLRYFIISLHQNTPQ